MNKMNTSTASTLVTRTLLFVVLVVVTFAGWTVGTESTKTKKHCVEYAQNTGECVRSMTVEELVNNAKE